MSFTILRFLTMDEVVMKKNDFRRTFQCLAAMFCLFVLTAISVLASPAEYDFDGDGRTDGTIHRYIFNGSFYVQYWFTLRSRDGFQAIQWGDYRDAAPAARQYIP